MLVLLYGIAFSIIALNSSVALTLDLYHLFLKPKVIYPATEVVFPSYDEETSSISTIRKAYDYIDLFSFVVVWGASVLLLHEYLHKWKLRHWVLVFIPLVYYVSTVIDDFGIYSPSDAELLSYYLYISLNSTAGGLLFGFAFLIVARHIHNDIFKGYMIISAVGFVLLFISNQVTLVATAYPPFGTITMSFYSLSTFLILLGLYSSAISVSQDAALRRSIRKSVMDKSKLLGGIGKAEMQMEVQKWVKSLGDMHEKTKISSPMTPEDVRSYVEEIVNEVRKKSISR
jgi:hypothetical protein